MAERAEQVRIFFREEDAGFVGSILSGAVRTESMQMPLKKRIKIERIETGFSPAPFAEGIMHATIDAGSLDKLKKLVAIGRIDEWKEREKRAGKGREKYFGEQFVRIMGHPVHKDIFLTPFNRKDVQLRGSRTIDEKMPGALRVELLGKSRQGIVSRAFKTYHAASGISGPKPTLVLYVSRAAENK